MQQFSSYNWFTKQREPQSSYCSAMPWALGLQFYYAIADPKVGEEHILRKHSKWNSFQVIPDLFNSKKPQIAIAQLCHEL